MFNDKKVTTKNDKARLQKQYVLFMNYRTEWKSIRNKENYIQVLKNLQLKEDLKKRDVT